LLLYAYAHDTVFNACLWFEFIDTRVLIFVRHLALRTTRWEVLTPLDSHVQVLEFGACGFSRLLQSIHHRGQLHLHRIGLDVMHLCWFFDHHYGPIEMFCEGSPHSTGWVSPTPGKWWQHQLLVIFYVSLFWVSCFLLYRCLVPSRLSFRSALL